MRLSDILKKLQTEQQKEKPLAEKEQVYKEEQKKYIEETKEKQQLQTETSVVEKIYAEATSEIRQFYKNITSTKDIVTVDSINKIVNNIIKFINTYTDDFLVYSCYTTADNYLYSHCVNTGIYSALIGIEKDFTYEMLSEIILISFLHEVCFNENINEEEYFDYANKQVKKIQVDNKIKNMLVNISGYVNNLISLDTIEDETTKLYAEIIYISDNYETMTHPRPNKERILPYDAISILIKNASQEIRKYNPSLVKLFVEVMSIFPVGSYVKLNTGEVGKVIGVNRSMPLRPKIKVVLSAENVPLKEEVVINLAENTKINITEAVDETKLDIKDKKFLLQLKAQRWWVKDTIF